MPGSEKQRKTTGKSEQCGRVSRLCPKGKGYRRAMSCRWTVGPYVAARRKDAGPKSGHLVKRRSACDVVHKHEPPPKLQPVICIRATRVQMRVRRTAECDGRAWASITFGVRGTLKSPGDGGHVRQRDDGRPAITRAPRRRAYKVVAIPSGRESQAVVSRIRM